MTEPIILARAVHFAASVLAAGTAGFIVLVAEPAFGRAGKIAFGVLRRRANAMIWGALAVAILSGIAWLALLAADIYGSTVISVCLHGGLWPVLTGTRFGVVWMARLAVALLLALLMVWPATRYLQLTAAAALLAGLAFIGHAGATPGTFGDLHLLSDIVHLLAAGCWLGGLPALALLLLTTARSHGAAARASTRFSVLGILSVGALTVTGLINSWALLGEPSDLVFTSYGRTLALKLGLFAAMLGIAAVNRFYLTPRLAKSGARTALARNSLAETTVGMGILLLVGALGTMAPTAHTVLPPPDIPKDAAFVHIHTAEAMADVTINPGRVGEADVIIRILREDSSELPANEVRLTADRPLPGAQSVNRTALRQPDGSWQVNRINFEQPGNWTVRITIAQEGREPIVLDAPIVIDR